MKNIYTLLLLCATIFLASCQDDDTVIASAVSLDKTTLSLVAGTQGTLTATITPDDVEVKDLTWMSCNESIAKVDDKGVVTAIAVGKATVTVVTRSGGKSASCEVIVTAAPVAVTGVTLDKTVLSLNVDDKVTLVATIAPEDATNTNVKWTTSDDKIATISATGEITAIAAGAATITVTTEDGNKTATCVVTVADRPAYRFYGGKNNKMVYYDGKELKNVGDLNYLESFIGNVVQKGDFYILSSKHSNYTFIKNGEVTSKDGKLPIAGFEYINGICASDDAFYACGTDSEKKAACWKNGTKLFSVDGLSDFSTICILGNDLFAASGVLDASSGQYVYVYKNSEKIAKIVGRLKQLAVYDGKVYLTAYTADKCYLYVYNGTTMVEAASTNGFYISYFSTGGNAMFTLISSKDNKNIYKNVDWSTALPSLELPAGVKDELPYLRVIIGEGDDVYTYSQCTNSADEDKYELYCWKNSLKPIRMPADSIDALIYIGK